MTSNLTAVSTSSLERLRDGLANQRLRAPLHATDLVAFGVREQLEPLLAALEGHSRLACLSILDAVLAERAQAQSPDPELVWTGPEGHQATARDTAVVLRELFRGARRRVVLAGYSFSRAESVLRPLYEVMERHGVEAIFFVDIEQATASGAHGEEHGRAALEDFLQKNWPFGNPCPTLYCDRQALEPGPPYSSLHAKCVTVDGERAFISSANFTTSGQYHNFEAGVLLHNSALATQLERQWMSLVDGDLVFARKPHLGRSSA